MLDHSRPVRQPVLYETIQKTIISTIKLAGNIFLKKKDQELVGGEGVGNAELLFNGHRVSVWEDEKVLETDDCDGCTTCERT